MPPAQLMLFGKATVGPADPHPAVPADADAELDRLAVQRERRNWRWRYFLATGADLEQRIAALIAHRPVVCLGDGRNESAVASPTATGA